MRMLAYSLIDLVTAGCMLVGCANNATSGHYKFAIADFVLGALLFAIGLGLLIAATRALSPNPRTQKKS